MARDPELRRLSVLVWYHVSRMTRTVLNAIELLRK
jgi:hypothetical protein